MSEAVVIQKNCTIKNQYGLHTRSAAAIVALANQFQCSITLTSDKGESDAADMIRLMLLEAAKGSEVCISASGEDAQRAVTAMSELIDAGFHEEE